METLFTVDQVRELLRQQREICYENADKNLKKHGSTRNNSVDGARRLMIRNAHEPDLGVPRTEEDLFNLHKEKIW